jgi:tetratricopeptide (TPR) repeat protein
MDRPQHPIPGTKPAGKPNRHLLRRPWTWGCGLGSLLAGLTLGCFPQASVPLVPASPPAPAAKEVVHDKDVPKHPPQASTCIAFGNLELEAAVEGERTPAQRQDLYDRARKYFQQALKEDSKCLEAYEGLAQAYQGLGDHPRLVETYQKAKKTFPKNAVFCFELGMCQARHREWEPALENLKAATDLDPENRTYANMRAFALARAGRYKESFDCFKQIVGEAQAHYNVARMLHHVKQEEICKNELRLALKADPKLAGARRMLTELEGGAAPAEDATTPAGFEDGEQITTGGEGHAVPQRVHKGIQ